MPAPVLPEITFLSAALEPPIVFAPPSKPPAIVDCASPQKPTPLGSAAVPATFVPM